MVDPDTGEVDRETVFNVLRHHKVDLSPDPLQAGNTLMVRGTVALSLPFDEWVKRKTTELIETEVLHSDSSFLSTRNDGI